MNYLSEFDLFGSSYIPTLKNNNKKYRSPLGGFLTILVYSLSLAYFIYKFYLWLDGQISPNVTTILDTQQYLEYQFKYNPISIDLTNRVGIDPFDPNNLIILPTLHQQSNQEVLYSYSLLDQVVSNTLSGRSKLIVPTNLSMQFNADTTPDDIRKLSTITNLVLEVCNPQTYNKCADQETINKYLAQPLIFMTVNITTQQFNHKSERYEYITHSLNYPIETDRTLFNRIGFKFQKAQVTRGFPIEYVDELVVLSDFIQGIQSLGQQFFTAMAPRVLVAFQLEINQLLSVQTIQYPQLPQILAEVGSILSTLLVLKIVAVAINQYLLEEQMITTLIGYYFPKIKSLTINRNWYGSILSVFEGSTEVELTHFKTTYRHLCEIAEEKLNPMNQLYELSRLQFILQSHYDRQAINMSHKVGIRINWHDQHEHEMEVIDSSNNLLVIDDFQLLMKFNDNYGQSDNAFNHINGID